MTSSGILYAWLMLEANQRFGRALTSGWFDSRQINRFFLCLRFTASDPSWGKRFYTEGIRIHIDDK